LTRTLKRALYVVRVVERRLPVSAQ
jgi:hypothetical protein